MTGAPATHGVHRPSTIAIGLTVGVLAVGWSAIAARYAIDGGAGPVAISFWRCFAGALALTPAALHSRRGQPPLPRGRRWQVVAAGLFLGLHFALWLSSLEYTTVASSVTLVTMSPIFVALGARRFLGEQVARRTWIGMLLTIVGAVTVGLADQAAVDLGPRALFGDALAFAGAMAVAGYMLTGRAVRRDVSISRYATGAYGVAALVLLPLTFLLDQPLVGYDAKAWWAIVAIVIGPQLLGHTIFNALLSSVEPTTVAIVVLSEPVLSTLLAWTLLDELPAPLFWLGAPVVLLGVAVATTRRRRRRDDEEDPPPLPSEPMTTR